MKKPIIVSIINNKGGCGKTSIALSLSSMLADDRKVLLVDNDRQGNATDTLLQGQAYEQRNIMDLYQEKPFDVVDIFKDTPIKKQLFLLPGAPNIEDIRSLIDGKMRREEIMRAQISDTVKDFDVVIIDNPPSLDVYSYNALYASDYAIIPFKPGGFEYAGMQNLLTAIDRVNKSGHGLQLLGVLVNMYNSRTKAAAKYINMLLENLPDQKIFNTMIPISQDFINATMDYVPIDLYPNVDKDIIDIYKDLRDEFFHKIENFEKAEG